MSCNAKKDPNGTWRIQYRWTDWTGTKKKSQKRGFKTKKEAEEWYAHFMLQQSSDPTMTLADFWEIYKADMEKRLRKTTMKQKEYVMNDKVLPYFGKTPINEITAPMIRKWQGEMIEKGFKPTYLKTIHNQLSAILNYAVNFYDLRSNPCRKAGSMGKSKADERPYWTLEEFQKFSDAIMDKQDSWIGFQILFWTGMRIGELLALQVKDIDFEQGTLTVDESLTRLDGEDLITAPKTESSVRVITIHKELQDEIKEYIATLYHVRPGTRLFAGRTKSFFEHEMERGIKLSGVKKITVHCTRHSHASMLVQMGFSPVEIAKRLGHGKVTTTIETYCHQSMDAQEKIADRLGKVERGEGEWLVNERTGFGIIQLLFWLSDEEKNQVEAKIVLSGISKGEYYRKAVLGQEVTVIAGNYMSVRVAKVLEQILIHLQNDNTEEEGLLLELVKQLLEANKNAPAGNKGIYE